MFQSGAISRGLLLVSGVGGANRENETIEVLGRISSFTFIPIGFEGGFEYGCFHAKPFSQ